MRDSRPMRMAAVIPAAALILALASGATRAACGVTAESVAEAQVAFVGTLTFASDDGSIGRFDVEDVWKSGGLALSSPVSVQGQPGMFSMAPGGAGTQIFLVLAEAVDGAPAVTGNNCSSWLLPWDASYAAFRPVDTPPPSAEGGPARPIPVELLALVAAMAVLVLGAVVAFRRRPEPGDGPT